MKKDTLYGPPKEIFQDVDPQKQKKKNKKVDDSSESDDEEDVYAAFENED